MPETSPIEFKNVFNPITKTHSTEVIFDIKEEVYTMFLYDGSPILWIHDEAENIGLSREFLKVALPILQRFVETGEIKP